MGFFSFETTNTGKSIANRYSGKKMFPVVLIADDLTHWVESNYEGYGEFGGKDIYELIAEMNGFKNDDYKSVHATDLRGVGIAIHTKQRYFEAGKEYKYLDGYFGRIIQALPKPSFKFPNLLDFEAMRTRDFVMYNWKNKTLKDCPNQGYFY